MMTVVIVGQYIVSVHFTLKPLTVSRFNLEWPWMTLN